MPKKNWKNENYLISKEKNTNSSGKIKIGLNWKVGTKWPSKSWPIEKWQELRELISTGPLAQDNCEVSWQEGLNDLSQYIDWINSCDIIITHDSLGLHLAVAAEKKTIALFGPTDPHELPQNKNLVIINSNAEKNFGCMPCYLSKCNQATHCMDNLKTSDILNSVSDFLKVSA